MQKPQIIFIAVIIGISALCQLPGIHDLMIWDRSTVLDGEIWRILAGNLAHTNWPHFIMNSLALVVISYIFRDQFSARRYAITLFILSVIVGIGLFGTNLQWYAGLSGVLHGLFAVESVRDVLRGRHSSWLLLAGLAAKLGHEHFFGGSVSSAAFINAEIATEAHLIGAIAEIVVILMFAKLQTIESPVSRAYNDKNKNYNFLSTQKQDKKMNQFV